MKAVMYGAGNIGRGFIGALLGQSGYEVTFIDVAKPVVDELNTRKEYPVRIVSSEGHEDTVISGVNAIDGTDTEAVANAIAGADILATAVGVNVLKFIVPNIAAGLQRRFEATNAPLNILICENLMDANKVLEDMLKQQLPAALHPVFDERVGLVEASIGRMVPVQTEAMKDGDALRVCVERYGFLPVDRDAFKGPIPEVKNMIPFSPFHFYISRKLYVHNMGHATCAYLGMLRGCEYIWQSIADADTFIITQNAMLESARALSGHYGVPLGDILLHIEDLLHRFTNKALGDTCLRVGGDTNRKLSPADRMIGSYSLCLAQGVTPAYISVGVAGALAQHMKEAGLPQTAENAQNTLATLSGLDISTPESAFVLQLYNQIIAGTSIEALRGEAAAFEAARLKGIV